MQLLRFDTIGKKLENEKEITVFIETEIHFHDDYMQVIFFKCGMYHPENKKIFQRIFKIYYKDIMDVIYSTSYKCFEIKGYLTMTEYNGEFEEPKSIETERNGHIFFCINNTDTDECNIIKALLGYLPNGVHIQKPCIGKNILSKN